MKLSDRNRFEYRIRSKRNDVWRYRNSLTLKLPFKWTGFKIQPYVAEEIFVDLDKGDLERNRVYNGLEAKLMEHLNLEIYYLWQRTKSAGDWIDINVIGSKLKFVF